MSTPMSAPEQWDESRSAAGDRNPWLIAAIVSIATFMEVLDTSIANVALQQIAGSLGAGLSESTWVLTTYLVASAVIVPISGWLSEVIGRKRYYMVSVAVFTAASMLCGMAGSLSALIVARVLQGLGGGGLAASEQSIITDTFAPAKRAGAFALYGISVVVAPTLGPTLGGWITDNLSWHWIFFINVPVGIASLLLVQWLIVDPPAVVAERKALLARGLKVDWVGFLLVALFLGCLEIVLDKGQEEDWFASGFITTFAVVSAVSLACFIPWELTRKEPIVDIRLLAHRQFGVAFVAMLAVGGILVGSTQLLPQLMQSSFAYTATWSGLALMPGGFATLLLMPVSAGLSRKVQPKYLMAAGFALVALGMWHSSGFDLDASFGHLAWMRVVQVVGLPLLFVPINGVAYSGLRPGQSGHASALINVARNLGGSIGVSLANAGLAQRGQMHQSRLVESVVPSSVGYQHGLRQVTDYFVHQGSSLGSAQRQAIAWIGQAVATQSTLLSYVDVFCGYAAFALLMALVVLALKRVNLAEAKLGH